MLSSCFIRAEKLPAERNANTARTPQQAIVLYVIPVKSNKLRAAVHAPITRAANAALIAGRFITFDDPAVRRQDINAKNVDAETVSDISQEPRKPAQISPDTARSRPSFQMPCITVAGVVRRLEPPKPPRQIAVFLHKKGRTGATSLPTIAISRSSGIRTAHLNTQLSISTPAKSIRVLRVGA